MVRGLALLFDGDGVLAGSGVKADTPWEALSNTFAALPGAALETAFADREEMEEMLGCGADVVAEEGSWAEDDAAPPRSASGRKRWARLRAALAWAAVVRGKPRAAAAGPALRAPSTV